MPLLPVPPPYDFALSTERFRAFGPDLANLWHEHGLHRLVARREVRVEAAEGGVRVEPLDGAVEPVVRTLLGLAFDLDGFARFALEDPVLAGLVDRLRGLRPPLAPDPFEALVTSITAQQVSLFSAFATRNRFIRAFGEPGAVAYAFPRVERVAAATEDELVATGLSRRKAEAVLALARDPLDHEELARLPDDEVKARIVARRGLGEWTADWYLARHLARPDAWPAGDLGLRKAVSAFYLDGRPVAEAEVRAFGDRFGPYRNLAAQYLLVGLRVAGRAPSSGRA